MSNSILVYRVVEWDRRYETRGSLKKAGARDAVPALTDLARIEMQRLLDAPGGFAAFGVWQIIWSLAARSQRRGALVVGGLPLTAQELARVARCDMPVVVQALELLCSPGIGLLEQVPMEEALRPPVIPPAPPRKPRKPKPPLEKCPFCQADLTVFVVPPLGGAFSDREGPPEDGTTNGSSTGAAPSRHAEFQDGQEYTSHVELKADGQDCPSYAVDAGSVRHDHQACHCCPSTAVVERIATRQEDRGQSNEPRVEPGMVAPGSKPARRNFSPYRVPLGSRIAN